MKCLVSLLLLVAVVYCPAMEREVVDVVRGGGVLPPEATAICGKAVEANCVHNDGGTCRPGAKIDTTAPYNGSKAGGTKNCSTVANQGASCLNSFTEAVDEPDCDPKPVP